MKRSFLIILLLSGTGMAWAQQRPGTKNAGGKAAPSARQIRLNNDTDSLSYALGFTYAQWLKEQGVASLNYHAFDEAVKSVLAGRPALFDLSQATMTLQEKLQALMQKKSEMARREGEKFLAENKTRQGVTTLPDGLQYEVLQPGAGPKPAATDTVKVHYTGRLTDGKTFDSSVERGEPAVFPVNRVIKGWTEALQLMPVGAKWRLYIPPQLGYGERGAGPIPPNAVLVFDVELLSIVNK